MAKVFKGDIGTKLVVDVSINISTATVKKIFYRKPYGASGYWTGTLEADNESLSFTTTVATDLDEVGTWTLQAYVEMPGWKGFGDVTTELVIYATPAAVADTLTPGTNTWATTAEAEAYFRTRLGASAVWNEDADKAAALVTAYKYLVNSGLWSFPDTAVQAMKDAQCEMALFLLKHMADMDARHGLQAQGVTQSQIVGETYSADAAGQIAVPAGIKGMLADYEAGSPLLATDVTRVDEEDV